MEQTVELTIVALSKSKTTAQGFVMVLEDESSTHYLPIIIGAAEAQYMGIVLEKLQTKRPMTHDLLLATLRALGGQLLYVLLHSWVDGIFIASIHVLDNQGQTHVIDARASDAVALALAQKVRILATMALLNDTALRADIYAHESTKTLYTDYSIAELEELLQKVLDKEDYESAARIRESLNKKRNSK